MKAVRWVLILALSMSALLAQEEAVDEEAESNAGVPAAV